MTNQKLVFFGLTLVVASVVVFGWKVTARAAYETAEYTVSEKDGKFEIREYPDLTLVTTKMRFEGQGNDGSFMRLFRYISGENNLEQKVAMTTPVFMAPDDDDTPGRMAFVLPKSVAEQKAVPKPSSDKVDVRTRKSGRFAVVRFSGRMSPELFKENEKELRDWISSKQLESAGEAESAGYDPPWTPAALRRNEILIRLK